MNLASFAPANAFSVAQKKILHFIIIEKDGNAYSNCAGLTGEQLLV